MQRIIHALVVVAAAGLVACERGDVVLGDFWRTDTGGAAGAVDVAAGNGGSSAAGSGGMAVGMPEAEPAAAAGSGTPAAAAGGAGSPAPAGMGGAMAGAPAANPVARPSSGCGQEPLANDSGIVLNGARANYLLELPVGYDKTRAYPLVLAFRGMSATVEEFRAELNLASVVSAVAIVVYPNPMIETAPWEFTRDMPLVERLVAKLKAGNCVDEDRVFALGAGAGSRFVNLVGCVLAGQVRAIALLDGAPVPPGPCAGQTAVWLVQGNADPMIVSINASNRAFWAGRNSCDLRMSSPVSPAGCVEYAGCDPDFPVRYCEHAGDGLPSYAASGAWNFFLSL